jgi:hypothetical protein
MSTQPSKHKNQTDYSPADWLKHKHGERVLSPEYEQAIRDLDDEFADVAGDDDENSPASHLKRIQGRNGV